MPQLTGHSFLLKALSLLGFQYTTGFPLPLWPLLISLYQFLPIYPTCQCWRVPKLSPWTLLHLHSLPDHLIYSPGFKCCTCSDSYVCNSCAALFSNSRLIYPSGFFTSPHGYIKDASNSTCPAELITCPLPPYTCFTHVSLLTESSILAGAQAKSLSVFFDCSVCLTPHFPSVKKSC